ncbi:MAG: 5-guanidino-2-oxopentanoate decarboxylase [Marinosulfonomonas sp.]|nr:5-guanidino-2-oxopentanoate decarboxylase [Marinosulfonomonas sp.]
MAGRTLGGEIAFALRARGVDTVFGIPGVHNVEMYRGIEAAGITHVLARHEQGAGFMADGYARASGKPGVAFVISGPGLTNIMTPMGQAYSDSVPLLVISSCLPDVPAIPGRLHEMRDQEGAAACVCDWSETAKDGAHAFELLNRAFDEFATQRSRPKHIQIPTDVLATLSDPAPKATHSRPETADVSPDVMAQIVTRLRGAKRPLFILGGGAISAVDFARRALAHFAAASFTTYTGRGIARPDDPLAFGSYLARPGSADVIGGSDCVVAIGATLAEVDLWRDTLGHDSDHMFIRVDIDAAVLADGHGADICVQADAQVFLSGLIAASVGHKAKTLWRPEQIGATRARWRGELENERPGIVPLCDALRAALPPKTMICSDMTQLAYVAKEVWDMAAPGLWHHPYGFGTLGYGLPAAIGAKLARPDQPVVAIAGDYGFQYTMQELGVAAELGLSLPIILWDNGKLGEIEDCMVAAQIAPNAVRARNPDFERLAAAYGAGYQRPRSLAEVKTALQVALQADGPTIVHLSPAISSSN